MILASKSPRRKEILDIFFNSVIIETEDIEEISSKIQISEQIKEIAYKKCCEIAEKNKASYVVAADTVVVYDERILGKPKDKADAFKMLKMLSGKEHEVITAYCLINCEKKILINEYDVTKVIFNQLSDSEINWYLETNEAYDKAGAYGIQGKGNILVKEIKGDFYNVMGFPLSKFIEDLKKHGYKIEEIEYF